VKVKVTQYFLTLLYGEDGMQIFCTVFVKECFTCNEFLCLHIFWFYMYFSSST